MLVALDDWASEWAYHVKTEVLGHAKYPALTAVRAIEILIERLASEAVSSSNVPGVESGAVASTSCHGGAAASEESAQSESRRLPDAANSCTSQAELARTETNGSQVASSGEAETQVLQKSADTVGSQQSFHEPHEGTDKGGSISGSTGLRRHTSELSVMTRSFEELLCRSMNPEESARSEREILSSSAAGTPEPDRSNGRSHDHQEQIPKQTRNAKLRIPVGK